MKTNEIEFINFASKYIDSSYAQNIQDLWALWENRGVAKGYFVEFGALSGINVSNSYLHECLGWDGIVAEPHPGYADVIKKNRKCHISFDAVYSISGKKLVFKAVTGSPALSTLQVSLPNDNQKNQEKRQKAVDHIVTTISLLDLLKQFNAPEVIDFISIDTEGSEVEILSTFDFTMYSFKTICVEYGTDEKRKQISDILGQHGYVRKWEHLSKHDDWYVNPSLLESSDIASQIDIEKLLLQKNELVPRAKQRFRKEAQALLNRN